MQPRRRLMLSGLLAANDYNSFYASDSRMTAASILFFALIGGCLLMLWFFTELRAQLPDGLLSRIAYSAAIVGVVALPAGASILGGPAGAQQSASTEFVGVPVAAAFAQAGLGLMLGIGMVGFALATLLMSIAARRSGLVPSWLGFLGSALGVLAMASYFWLPGFAFVIWVFVTGVTLGTGSQLQEAHVPALVAQTS